MKQELYYIMYSSATLYSVYVSHTRYLVRDKLSRDEADQLVSSLVADCNYTINNLEFLNLEFL